MTDKNKPISASNPPESKGNRDRQVVKAPVIVDGAKKKLTPKTDSKK